MAGDLGGFGCDGMAGAFYHGMSATAGALAHEIRFFGRPGILETRAATGSTRRRPGGTGRPGRARTFSPGRATHSARDTPRSADTIGKGPGGEAISLLVPKREIRMLAYFPDHGFSWTDPADPGAYPREQEIMGSQKPLSIASSTAVRPVQPEGGRWRWPPGARKAWITLSRSSADPRA